MFLYWMKYFLPKMPHLFDGVRTSHIHLLPSSDCHPFDTIPRVFVCDLQYPSIVVLSMCCHNSPIYNERPGTAMKIDSSRPFKWYPTTFRQFLRRASTNKGPVLVLRSAFIRVRTRKKRTKSYKLVIFRYGWCPSFNLASLYVLRFIIKLGESLIRSNGKQTWNSQLGCGVLFESSGWDSSVHGSAKTYAYVT